VPRAITNMCVMMNFFELNRLPLKVLPYVDESSSRSKGSIFMVVLCNMADHWQNGKMAAEQYVLSHPLCFLINKFGKCQVKLLKVH